MSGPRPYERCGCCFVFSALTLGSISGFGVRSLASPRTRQSDRDAAAHDECVGSIVVAALLIASRSQIGELNFPDHAHVAVYLALRFGDGCITVFVRAAPAGVDAPARA